MSNFEIQKESEQAVASYDPRKIGTVDSCIIGIGGAGCNMTADIWKERAEGEELQILALNTDKQALDALDIPDEFKMVIGKNITKGLGAGSDVEKGCKAAEENLEDIRKILEHKRMVYILAGFGGGTGTGAAPVIAKMAKEMDILTICLVAAPFSFEGNRRYQTAQNGLDLIGQSCDNYIWINNQKLLESEQGIDSMNLKFDDAFAYINKMLSESLLGLNRVINTSGLMNLDFADILSVMKNGGRTYIGFAETNADDVSYDKDNPALATLKKALSNTLFTSEIYNAQGVLIQFEGDVSVFDIQKATEEIGSRTIQDATVAVGVAPNNSDSSIRVTVIATGFVEDQQNATMNGNGFNERRMPVIPQRNGDGVESLVMR